MFVSTLNFRSQQLTSFLNLRSQLTTKTPQVKDQAAAFVKLVSEIAEHLSSLTQKECSDQGVLYSLVPQNQEILVPDWLITSPVT